MPPWFTICKTKANENFEITLQFHISMSLRVNVNSVILFWTKVWGFFLFDFQNFDRLLIGESYKNKTKFDQAINQIGIFCSNSERCVRRTLCMYLLSLRLNTKKL